MLLALDTATATSTIALFDPATNSLLAEQVWQSRRRQTEELLPALAEMLARLECSVDDIQIIAVTTGPGSFSGVRIGISTVKGLALGLAKQPLLIGLPVLSVTAAPFMPMASACGAAIWPMLQAGRGRFNWATAPAADPLWLPSIDDHRAGQLEAFVQAVQEQSCPVWLVGELNAALIQAAQILPHVHCIDPVTGLRRGGILARLAVRHWQAGSPAVTDPIEPLYLRPPR